MALWTEFWRHRGCQAGEVQDLQLEELQTGHSSLSQTDSGFVFRSAVAIALAWTTLGVGGVD